VQLGRRRDNIAIDLPPPVKDRVGHRDPIDSTSEYALVGLDPAKHARIEAIAFGAPIGNVAQRCPEKLERGFFRLRAVIPETSLLKEVRGHASERGHLEVEQRCAVLAAVAHKADFGCCSQRTRHAAASAAGMKKSHADGGEQRPFKIAQHGANQLRPRTSAEPFRASEPKRAFNGVQRSPLMRSIAHVAITILSWDSTAVPLSAHSFSDNNRNSIGNSGSNDLSGGVCDQAQRTFAR
jgi:hypothetical protein